VIDAPGSVLVAGDFNTNWIKLGRQRPGAGQRFATRRRILDSYMASLAFDAPSADSGPTEHAYGLTFKLDSISPAASRSGSAAWSRPARRITGRCTST